MLFKYSVSLLYFILAANSVLKDKNKAIDADIELIDVVHFTKPDQTKENLLKDSDDGNKATSSFTAQTKQTEDEILKDSYDNCRKWLGKPPNSTMKMSDFWLYMGKTKSEEEVIRDYFQKNPEASKRQADIDLNLYGELFKHLCSIRGLTLKECAALGKRKAASRIVTDYIFRLGGSWLTG